MFANIDSAHCFPLKKSIKKETNLGASRTGPTKSGPRQGSKHSGRELCIWHFSIIIRPWREQRDEIFLNDDDACEPD